MKYIHERARALSCAMRGVVIFIKETPHALIQLSACFGVAVCAWYFELSSVEIALLVCAVGLVVITEAINTALETHVDLTTPEYHALARDTKDIAAGAVLLASIFAAAVGLLVFVPHIL